MWKLAENLKSVKFIFQKKSCDLTVAIRDVQKRCNRLKLYIILEDDFQWKGLGEYT